MKKTISLVLVLVLLITVLPIGASAIDLTAGETKIPITKGDVDIGNISTVDEEDIFVSEEEAGYIAQLFVNDTIEAGVSSWNSDTSIASIVTMYDNTGENNITAYSVEFDKGYVVVSAYLGIENIIIEWSDTASPIYKGMETADSDRIIYLGALACYKDLGDGSMETANGYIVPKVEVANALETARDVGNVPVQILASIVQSKGAETTESIITNPYTHANRNYAGPFKYSSHINKWDTSENHLRVIDMAAFNDYGYENHCGPTAITNMLRMYGNRFNVSSIKRLTDYALFTAVVKQGDGKYYFNMDIGSLGGTINALTGAYISECFDNYGLDATCTRTDISYDNIRATLLRDRLMDIIVMGHGTYGRHQIVGYAYTRLVSTTTGYYKTYVKIADGWSTSPRYADLATLTSDTYWDVKISR